MSKHSKRKSVFRTMRVNQLATSGVEFILKKTIGRKEKYEFNTFWDTHLNWSVRLIRIILLIIGT